jgi:hypothetical protein
VYSPALPSRLISPLYHLAKAQGRPMTKVAGEAIERYLAEHGFAAGDIPDREDSFVLTPRGRAALDGASRAA